MRLLFFLRALRVGAQKLHEQNMFLHIMEGLSNVRVRGVSFEVDKENIFPGFPLVGSGLDLGQIDPFFVEDLKDPMDESVPPRG